MAFRYAQNTDDPKAGKWEVNGIIVAETDKAILLDDGDKPQWLPKRGLVIEKRRDGTHDVAMPEWLAKDKGFV